MSPIAFQIGPLTVRWYGLLIVLGAVVAAFIASREARRRGEDPDHVWSAFIWLLIGGIIGARLQYVISSSIENPAYVQEYLSNPIKIIATWEGGVGIFGAIIGGLLAFLLYARRHRLNFWRWADIIIVGLPFAQAIGRWGNFFNQELYGGPTNLPWGIAIDCAHRVEPYFCPPQGDFTEAARFHPTFLYESLWNLFVGFTLLFLARRYGDRWPAGSIFNLYLVFYPIGRFLVEFIRLGTPFAFGLTIGQITSLVAGLAALAVFFVGFTLLFLARRYGDRWPAGSIFNLYLVFYPIGRFLVEFIRLGTPFAFGLTIGQITSLVAGLAALAVFFVRLRRAGSQSSPPAPAS